MRLHWELRTLSCVHIYLENIEPGNTGMTSFTTAKVKQLHLQVRCINAPFIKLVNTMINIALCSLHGLENYYMCMILFQVTSVLPKH